MITDVRLTSEGVVGHLRRAPVKVRKLIIVKTSAGAAQTEKRVCPVAELTRGLDRHPRTIRVITPSGSGWLNALTRLNRLPEMSRQVSCARTAPASVVDVCGLACVRPINSRVQQRCGVSRSGAL
jgi:hypothetical protein